MRLINRLVVAATVFGQVALSAENWGQWRGPSFNGSTREHSLPSSWTKTSAVQWSTELPGPSAATPVVWGDRIFVSSTDRANQALQAMGLDRKTGKILWNHKVADGYRRDDRSNYASPSPAADGERVVFFYGNGLMVTFDHAGKELWRRSITKDYGEFAFLWTFSSSPVLFDGRLYLQVLQRNVPVSGRGRTDGPIASYLLALDPSTGRELWRVTRPSEAREESLEAFSTPVPFEHNGRKEILIAGGDCLTGHDPSTGRELWRWGTWNPNRITHWRFVPSPAAGGGVVLACAPKGDPIYAIRAGQSGNLDDAAIAWKSDKRVLTADVPTAAFYDGDFFILSDVRKNLSRVSPATGAVKWTVELPGNKKFEASPLAADGRIHVMNFAGDVVVVDAKEGRIVHAAAMGEPGDDATRSSLVASQGQIFIRTNSRLFCVGGK